jgi:predicted DNA-binding protein
MESKTVSVRIGQQEAAAIERLSKALGKTQSDVLKEGIAALEEKLIQTRSAYEVGADLFGKHGSGRKDVSERRKPIYRERVREKHARR